MITWIASYPKSGNTWMKLFLKSYFNSSNSDFSINPKPDDNFKVENFPITSEFKNLNIQYKDFAEIAKNWISMQSLINLNNKSNYLKTHNAMCSINGCQFTNNENTIGAIYIVRDPRDVAISYSKFLGKDIDETIKYILSDSCFEQDLFENELYKKSIMGNWSYHYNSWKNYKSNEIIIVKYEDMLKKTNETFFKVLNYLNKQKNIEVNEKKMMNAINLTSFNNLQKLEKNEGFKENPSSKPFFRKGKIGEWKKILNSKQIQKIEKKFTREMEELKYL